MTTAKFVQPDNTSQEPADYKNYLDAAFKAFLRAAGAFAPHAQDTPVMTVRVDAGMLLNGTTLTEVAAQSTGTITAPVSDSRIDRVVVDSSTGSVSVITGTPGASPAVPALTSGKIPVCQVLLTSASTAITNSMITDERAMPIPPAAVAAATQAEMEAASSTSVFASPGRTQYHPGVAKAWAKVSISGGTPAVDASHNVTSLTDNGTGDITANWTTAFSSANYSVFGMARPVSGSNSPYTCQTSNQAGAALATGSTRFNLILAGSGLYDVREFYIGALGDQ